MLVNLDLTRNPGLTGRTHPEDLRPEGSEPPGLYPESQDVCFARLTCWLYLPVGQSQFFSSNAGNLARRNMRQTTCRPTMIEGSFRPRTCASEAISQFAVACAIANKVVYFAPRRQPKEETQENYGQKCGVDQNSQARLNIPDEWVNVIWLVRIQPGKAINRILLAFFATNHSDSNKKADFGEK